MTITPPTSVAMIQPFGFAETAYIAVATKTNANPSGQPIGNTESNP